jgi:hypothetical protein
VANHPSVLAIVFGVVHHMWAVRIRSRVAKYLADRISGLRALIVIYFLLADEFGGLKLLFE